MPFLPNFISRSCGPSWSPWTARYVHSEALDLGLSVQASFPDQTWDSAFKWETYILGREVTG